MGRQGPTMGMDKEQLRKKLAAHRRELEETRRFLDEQERVLAKLRARYPAVRPGYHQDKRHWNTVELDGSIEDAELEWMIEHSYELVVAGLPRKVRAELPGG